MTRTLAVLVFLACASTLCAPMLARGEEQPCRAVGDTVVCQRAGFDVLVGKLLDARKERDVCVLAAESSTADAKVLKARVDAAIAERDKAVADLAVEKARPKTRRLGAVGLGFLSGMALAAAPLPQSESVSVSLLGLSFGSAALATALVLSE